ncbi:unnamed protein product [Oncorhynchus mykiss]|uniref:Disintegrin domain-containing protein n=1 Tax=Oncorhynchus mykiss TaxID=8022 RepID=A0A060Y0W9_ONCMY|nr:unnamed protein product [Oncorhynchus mykiss]
MFPLLSMAFEASLSVCFLCSLWHLKLVCRYVSSALYGFEANLSVRFHCCVRLRLVVEFRNISSSRIFGKPWNFGKVLEILHFIKDHMCYYECHFVMCMWSFCPPPPTESGQPICGNGLVEPGEECDCGYSDQCRDQCCYDADQPDNRKCKLKPNKVCSPSQGPCCTPECYYKGRNEKCREESECAHQGMCNGGTAQCPTSEPKANFTACHGETQVCLNGVSGYLATCSV